MRLAVSATSRIPSETANSIQVLMACQGLADAGHELTLAFPGTVTPDFDAIRAQYGLHCAAFPISAVPSVRALRRLDFCARALISGARMRPDAIYTWTLQLAAIAVRRPFSRVPVIYEAHDLPSGRFGAFWTRRFIASGRPKLLVFITQALEARFRERFPTLAEAESVVAPNGINLQDYSALPPKGEARRRMGFPPDRKVISCSGHLYAGRGVPLFLDLAADFPEADFYWFGGTAESVRAYRETAAARGLSNVRFTGFIPKRDLPLAQAASDILLMPYGRAIAGSSGGNSAAICSPMKMFEYMAARRPIVTSDLPVLREVLDDRSARFCEPEERESWRAALKRLLDDEPLGEALAEAAFAKVQDLSWESRARRILAALP